MDTKNLLFTDKLDIMLAALLLTGKELAKNIGVSESLITELRGGRVQGKGRKFWRGICNKYPEWEPFLRGETDQPPNKSAAAREPITAYRDQGEDYHLQCTDPRYPILLEEIALVLNSPYSGIKEALCQNIFEIAQAVRDKDEIAALKASQTKDHATILKLVEKVNHMEDYINNIGNPGKTHTGTEEGG